MDNSANGSFQSMEAKRKAFEALKYHSFLKPANELTSAQTPSHLKAPTSSKNLPLPLAKKRLRSSVPLYQARVSAGLPSPTEDTIDQYIDLHACLIPNPHATFCVRVEGDSMLGASIHENDLLVVDTQKKPRTGNIIVASVYGELTVKRLKVFNERIFLTPENAKFKSIEITIDMDFKILGVVMHVIHSL